MRYTKIKSGTYTRNTVRVKHVKPKVYIKTVKTEKLKKMKTSINNIEQSLIELIADFLDTDFVLIQETIGLFKDPKERDKTLLHERMAKAAMLEYKKTIVKIPSGKKVYP